MGSAHLSATFEIATLSIMVVIIVVDLLLVIKRPHVPSFKECLAWAGFYIGLALVFGVILYFVTQNGEITTQFYTGFVVEKALSIDNLFIFIIILTRFQVPPQSQQTVLMIGILIALVLRGGMILIGSAVIERWSWVFYFFGAFLIYTAWTQLKPGSHGDEEREESRVVGSLRKRLAIADDYDGNKLRTVVDGRKMWTPLFLVIIALGVTDIVFALDSIPAIFGITTDPFVVFSTNLFALMGLRQLYFLLGGLMDRLVYLPYGLGAILLYIGAKLILEAMHGNSLSWLNGGQPFPVAVPSPAQSLLVILGVLTLTAVFSLTVGRKRAEKKAREKEDSAP